MGACAHFRPTLFEGYTNYISHFSAVKVLKENTIVGHVPRDISKYCTTLLLCGGKIRCEVTGRRQNKRGNGLEVCKFIVKRPHYITCKIDMIIKDYISRTQ